MRSILLALAIFSSAFVFAQPLVVQVVLSRSQADHVIRWVDHPHRADVVITITDSFSNNASPTAVILTRRRTPRPDLRVYVTPYDMSATTVYIARDRHNVSTVHERNFEVFKRGTLIK